MFHVHAAPSANRARVFDTSPSSETGDSTVAVGSSFNAPVELIDTLRPSDADYSLMEDTTGSRLIKLSTFPEEDEKTARSLTTLPAVPPEEGPTRR